ncbi:putative hydrocarbon oxygenase MocD [Candidatus Rhodobacter oscarellae]|uniref:Putative hydrocarbon oxygenase MocD n=1 Tax=Candidatus Rhodobacter oscarellae TaxID=1675527 RepID=A0A0J9E1R2_9RHOB|nr:fatty acid desaturase [Candidatus Rhodobacter lobularis]KMW56841.1 putative hydrocarbon oxygenase MocD [Candidatus Rhodobacter lobularis]
MDHKDVIAALPRQDLARLTQRQNRAGLWHLAGHLGLIVIVGAGIALRVPLWPLLLPLQGVLIVFLFTLEHEATHKTPFASGWLNEAVGHLSGLLILLPFTWFRYFHLAHHKYTNDPERDPELLAGGHPKTRAAYLWHVSGLPYWAGTARVLVVNALGRAGGSYLPQRALPRVAWEARAYLAVYAAAALSLAVSPLLFWVWLLPALLGQPALRLYLLAEHGRCAHVADMLSNTRTTFTNRVVRFLAWNMPYHIEHHAVPNVPFHRLPELHAHMAPHLKETAPGYRAFTRDYVQGLGPAAQ